MGEKKLREFLTPAEFKEEIIDWSRKTLDRKIMNEGFPHVKNGNRTYIPREQALLWLKKRGKGQV